MKKNTEKTNVMRLLEQKKIPCISHDYTDTGVVSGVEVAAVLNQNPAQVYKTLVTVGSSNANYVFLIPVQKELDLKKAARLWPVFCFLFFEFFFCFCFCLFVCLFFLIRMGQEIL